MRTIKILLTFGPASVPVDEVRRITNHSTGTLGRTLAEYFISQKHEVIAFRGAGATTPYPFPHQTFNTNRDLEKSLAELCQTVEPDLILHAAALSDYEIDRVDFSASNSPLTPAKIPSHHNHVTIRLKPAPKILPQLRGWFPRSTIISWKYELEGTPSQAIAKAQKQVHQKYADYSIINGKAYGEGFGVCDGVKEIYPHLKPTALATTLLQL